MPSPCGQTVPLEAGLKASTSPRAARSTRRARRRGQRGSGRLAAPAVTCDRTVSLTLSATDRHLDRAHSILHTDRHYTLWTRARAAAIELCAERLCDAGDQGPAPGPPACGVGSLRRSRLRRCRPAAPSPLRAARTPGCGRERAAAAPRQMRPRGRAGRCASRRSTRCARARSQPDAHWPNRKETLAPAEQRAGISRRGTGD